MKKQKHMDIEARTIIETELANKSSFKQIATLVGRFDFPDSEPFDITVKVTLVRSNSKKRDPADGYKVNFSVVAHICRVFLRLSTGKDPLDVMLLLQKELIPIRNKRQYPRLQTAHFRRPRYFIYRAA